MEARATTAAAIEVASLEKSFGDRRALTGVGFVASQGERLAVIGPNGAGKTTLLSIIAGSLKRDAGAVTISDRRVGFVPQQPALYRKLTVAENLELFARLEEVADVDAAVEEMLEQTALCERRDDQAGTLSGGNQQRVNIAIGLLGKPAVVLLDEPSSGLDARQRARLWEFVVGLADAGTTVVFTTHDIAEAERYGQRLLVLADGEALFDGSAAELHAAAGAEAGDAEGAFVRRRADALAPAQGSEADVALTAAHRAARGLPDSDRGPDRLRALGGTERAARRLAQRGAGGLAAQRRR
jgi:ABC-2 type transport system ATP-binding protein